MIVRDVRLDEKAAYNALVSHPVQSWEWGEFKRKTGVEVVRIGVLEGSRMQAAYQLSFHPIPRTSYSIGYFPKGPLPDKRMIDAISKVGNERKAIFIKLEPNIEKGTGQPAIDKLAKDYDLRQGKNVFTPHSFTIDLLPSEEELLERMKAKTRYNIGLAQRRGVRVLEDNDQQAFETYLRLTFETAKRQGFYAHDETYHRQMWEELQPSGIAHLLTATWNDNILVAWILFVFNGVLYYPYGASSNEHRNLMASNLMMWEAMRFGKRMTCQTFDLWGALGPQPDPKDPWFGFHRFKEGYGGNLIEFVGTYDLVLFPQLYSLVCFADDLRWKLLRFWARLR
ncbi:MAG: hypothetical protein A2785_03400 [Candidatus Chisholmbacteria bacterium RIFCSPHIGHO2_01_FULL_49_18]|uniref:BioF2-like acetyltransferase domain-containing protein n=2 Tax=Candidatus Chisholmiibacteriota TaxID=1817900 RepID=A0A1G1VNI7_9BACT|nr:MAG: hypothetical protein A2785_03400 [Candidatus Chisholmbacteria bacterium RIFCSPHIGHO2_01_FULL_49_18]OGY19520.1 MAG: hypothetical protein A3A65_06460 [Candidatus Chisholmbacteria bacterium RIFCSPLOWO2_01_FULL_49_14]